MGYSHEEKLWEIRFLRCSYMYMQDYLKERIGTNTRRDVLYEVSTLVFDNVEWTYNSSIWLMMLWSKGTNVWRDANLQQYVKGISETGMQSKDGLDGQLNACWLHKITTPETERIRSAGFLVSVIHGRYVDTDAVRIKEIIFYLYEQLNWACVVGLYADMMSLLRYVTREDWHRGYTLLLEWLIFMEAIL